jgi:hypothetical protein
VTGRRNAQKPAAAWHTANTVEPGTAGATNTATLRAGGRRAYAQAA